MCMYAFPCNMPNGGIENAALEIRRRDVVLILHPRLMLSMRRGHKGGMRNNYTYLLATVNTVPLPPLTPYILPLVSAPKGTHTPGWPLPCGDVDSLFLATLVQPPVTEVSAVGQCRQCELPPIHHHIHNVPSSKSIAYPL